jgi:hypothetical protein
MNILFRILIQAFEFKSDFNHPGEQGCLERYLLLYVVNINLSPNLTQKAKPCDGLGPPTVII